MINIQNLQGSVCVLQRAEEEIYVWNTLLSGGPQADKQILHFKAPFRRGHRSLRALQEYRMILQRACYPPPAPTTTTKQKGTPTTTKRARTTTTKQKGTPTTTTNRDPNNNTTKRDPNNNYNNNNNSDKNYRFLYYGILLESNLYTRGIIWLPNSLIGRRRRRRRSKGRRSHSNRFQKQSCTSQELMKTPV